MTIIPNKVKRRRRSAILGKLVIMIHARLGIFLIASCAAHAASAGDPRPAAGISDNSFLIEEAYNQEAGVVQHIATLARQNGTWLAAYTDEWPVLSQTHQVSYTVPFAWLAAGDGGAQGFGDIVVNYRYQALSETDVLPAFAPRASIILPTGDEDQGLGDGSIGYQFNLPFSKIIGARTTLHANAGMTSYFDVDGRQPTSFNLGGSIVYAATRDFNVMLEAVQNWEQSVDGLGGLESARALTLSPGIRSAFNMPEGQLVLGIAVPIEFSNGGRDYGVFIYASFEHNFLNSGN